MRIWILSLLLATGAAFAQDKPHSAKERKDDIARHRQLAALHEAAAKCLESGTPEKACYEQLRRDCKGVGIGRYCGMRHQH